MEQNDRLEKNKDFFQGKQLFNTKLLRSEIKNQLSRKNVAGDRIIVNYEFV